MHRMLLILLSFNVSPLFAGEDPNPQMGTCNGYCIRQGVAAQEVKNFGNMYKSKCDLKRDQDGDSLEKLRKIYCSHKLDELYVIWDNSLGHRFKIGGHVFCKDQ